MHSITVCHNLILITLSRRAQAIPLFALCAMLCTGGPAFAQQPPDPDAIQLFQQQFLEQLQLELEDAASLSPYNRPTAPAVQESAPGTESSQCVEINQILFTGNQVFPDYRIRRLVMPYENAA